jgi:rubrerythrin
MSDHHHDHDHDHHHHHGHTHETGPSEMSMAEKLEKMVSHWVKHNADHAETYRQWADRARHAGLSEVADILESVAKDSQAINTDLEKAGQVLKGE